MTEIAIEFEKLVRKVFTKNGFSIEENIAYRERYDFLAKIEDENWVVEVKYYRTKRAQLSLLDTAAIKLMRSVREGASQGAMLVVSCVIEEPLRKTLEHRHPDLIVIDRGSLLASARHWPSLHEEIASVLELSDVDPASPEQKSLESLIKTPPPLSFEDDGPTKPDNQGDQLYDRLKAIPKGKTGWAEYENICVEILRYLFDNDLHGWHKQFQTDDDLNRFDLVCRVRGSTDFWQFVIDQLHSRYMLFEFKNYADPIQQGQILTTEKYLLENGLRKAAIILTREKPSNGAVKTMQGAMREHGKLILVFDDEEVRKMLQMKQSGSDPTDLLFEAADNFLLSLPR